ncbi:MAG: acyl-CoA dehydrogenase family protein [Myxococcota bacterium]
MQLVLSEDQELLAKTAGDFLSERSPVARLRGLRDSQDATGFSRELWKEMAALGWVGITFPESVGGAGMGFAELAVVMERLGRVLAPEPFLSTVLLGGEALRLGGSEAQRAHWLPRLVEGDAVLSLAHQEPGARFDLAVVATRAEPAGEGFRLQGEKIGVLDGAVADALVIPARQTGADEAREGVTLFLVPADAPGLAVERQSRVDSRGAARLRLDGVPVDTEAIVGESGQGVELLETVVDHATLGLAAEMLGSMSEAFERTLDYLKQRQQFGSVIGSFQALKHRAARMFIEVELARSAVLAAARAVDAGADDASRLVSLAKARCSDTAMLVAYEAVQMHGGIGMTDEHEIGFFLKRARVAELTFGDAAWHRDRWARLCGY